MLSVDEHFEMLEKDLIHDPIRISAYHDMPFTIFTYDPSTEFQVRKKISLLAGKLEMQHGKKIVFISIGTLVWQAIHSTEGIDKFATIEEHFGFNAVQADVNAILKRNGARPIAELLSDKMSELDPEHDIVFLVRAGAFAPGLFRCSDLLNEMKNRTDVPMVLFYPGTWDGDTLMFIDLPLSAVSNDYNYRMKIYGGSDAN